MEPQGFKQTLASNLFVWLFGLCLFSRLLLWFLSYLPRKEKMDISLGA